MFTDCPTYTINLDLPPENRWDHIIPDFKDKIPLATRLADEMLGSAASAAITMLSIAHSMGTVAYSQELQGIAKATDMKVGKVLLLQLAYEAFAACTSVILNDKNNPIHIRTMDWDLPILKKLTIQLEFQRNGKTVFHGTTWAGYIGILTGMKARAFSVSINYRSTEEASSSPIKAFLRNIIRCISGYWPIGYLVRDTLDGGSDYRKALTIFKKSELIAPTYITVCGTRKNQGVIIARNRSPHDYDNGNVCMNLADGPLVQANIDHWRDIDFTTKNTTKERWLDICESKERRNFVLEAIKSSDIWSNKQTLAIIMATNPCYSPELTIYTSLMIPSASKMDTWINIKRGWKTKGKRDYCNIIKKCKNCYEEAIAV